MKQLPLLSSDFPYFSWDNEIEEATIEQLQNAYNALISQGLTTDFSRFVWNDLVDLLSSALSEASLSWNNSFGSVSETKMLARYEILTAKRFNAMTVNIDQLINLNWVWEVDTHTLGYVGRKRFYGVTERKEKGDYVYGSYIIELARVLNVFIAILKNEANFAELTINNISKTPTEVDLLARKSVPMEHATSSLTKEYVELLIRKSSPLSISLVSASEKRAEMLVKEIRYLISRVLSKSATQAVLSQKKAIRLSYRELSFTQHKMDLIKTQPKNMNQYVKNIKTTVEAGISFYGCIDMFFTKIHNTIQQSSLDIALSKAFTTENLSKSVSNADIHTLKGHALSDYAALVYSMHKSNIANVKSMVLSESEEQSSSLQKSIVDLPLAKHLDPAEIHVLSMNKTELLKKESMSIDSESISKSNQLSNVIAIRPGFIEAEEISNSRIDAYISNSLPHHLGVTENSKSIDTAELSNLKSLNFESKIKAKSSNLVKLTGGRILELSASILSRSNSISRLEFEGVEYDWVIQTGNNLYIRQTYISYQDGNILFVDIPVWYDVIQKGTNLYIRQVDTFWSDGNKGNIDTDVFLDPIQTGNNLYIRQAESIEGSDE